MKIVRAISVTDAVLASNVAETPPAEYDGGTTYDTGDEVSVTSGTVSVVYESRIDSNTGNAPASSPDEWREVCTTYEVYDGGPYSLGDVVTDTTGHQLYESLANSNSAALTDTDKWLPIAPSNRWAMHDDLTDTQTIRAGEIQNSYDITGRIDTLGLLNISATSVNVTMMDGATEAYNQDFSLISTDGIDDWYSYFFEPVERRTDLLVQSLPNVLDPTLIVTATDNDTVAIGHCNIGLSRSLGSTEWGAEGGIQNFSRFDTDDFGRTYIVPRGYNKRGKFKVWMPSSRVDYVFGLLAEYRATPVLIIGADEYTATYYFGLLKDWNIELVCNAQSLMTIEAQGF